MKVPLTIPIEDWLDTPSLRRRESIDARSPTEYAEDHLPGAINLPVLDDAERALIGTMDREQGAFAANRAGAARVSRRIAAMLEGPLADKPRDWSPIVYCWRGGSRSWSLATVLARIGWRVGLLEGGYRRYRQRVVADIEGLAPKLDLRVLAGPTGVGKTRLLQRALDQGLQVLDLEAIANHRGSVLGGFEGDPQPSQKAFESRLWHALRLLDPERAVLVESESRKIGRIHLPEPMIASMRRSPCIRIEASIPTRVALLRDEYFHFEADPAPLIERLERLESLHADGRVAVWREFIAQRDWDGLVASLLERHYDPAYFRSMSRNYREIGEAPSVLLSDAGDAALDSALVRIEAAIAASPRPSVPAIALPRPQPPRSAGG